MKFAFYYRHILISEPIIELKQLWDVICEIFDDNEDWVHDSVIEYKQDEDCFDKMREEVGIFLSNFEDSNA